MTRILGIDTSNYTTSIAVVEDGVCIADFRKLLSTRYGERGLRQSEALFQHIINLPDLLASVDVKNLNGVSVSIKPRQVEGSYMPVFKGGESIARAISSTSDIELILTTHQEGHIEAAYNSIQFDYKKFICMHLSGGTTEILEVTRDNGYKINIIGKTLDISAGQLIDRIGVAMGFQFPCGSEMDRLSMEAIDKKLKIPICVRNFDVNFSGQETKGIKFVDDGNDFAEIAYSIMQCVSLSLEKIINNLFQCYDQPILITGGVASSNYIRSYLKNKFEKIYFSEKKYASDNAVGVAYIGYNSLRRI